MLTLRSRFARLMICAAAVEGEVDVRVVVVSRDEHGWGVAYARAFEDIEIRGVAAHHVLRGDVRVGGLVHDLVRAPAGSQLPGHGEADPAAADDDDRRLLARSAPRAVGAEQFIDGFYVVLIAGDDHDHGGREDRVRREQGEAPAFPQADDIDTRGVAKAAFLEGFSD